MNEGERGYCWMEINEGEWIDDALEPRNRGRGGSLFDMFSGLVLIVSGE